MGNIQIEVLPMSFNSRRRKESKAVKRISMHQPVIPQIKNFCFIERSIPASGGNDTVYF